MKPDDERIGFLATLAPADNVFLGGMLITNRLGRPLEFQCTAPVEPNATQILLYGPTLKRYVLNDLIGKTLVDRVAVTPHVVLVDDRDLLELRRLIKQPVGCVCDGHQQPDGVQVGRNGLITHPDFGDDAEFIRSTCSVIPADADVAEPFERVRAALKEALSSSTPSSSHRGAA